MSRKSKIFKIARVCHTVHRQLCIAAGDTTQPPWDEAPKWLKKETIEGVKRHLSRNRPSYDYHHIWAMNRLAEGWVYGDKKSFEEKTNPALASYFSLEKEQLVRNDVFKSIVVEMGQQYRLLEWEPK